MRRPAIKWTVLGLISLLLAQAVLLRVTGKWVLLAAKQTRIYTYEGDLVSDIPPQNADEASRTKEGIGFDCRYWTGISVRHYLGGSRDECPRITLG